MPLNLASPGILVREVDLTIGRVDATTDKIGGIVGSFEKGPIEVPTQIPTENDLVNTFGKPYTTDKQYEDWLVASSYLAYGGQLSVIRADDQSIYNSYVGTASSVKVKSIDHYEELGYDENVITGKTVVGKNPGVWANGIRVAIIDGIADQTLTLASAEASLKVGSGITQTVPSNLVRQVGAGVTEVLDGHFKGKITKVDGTGTTIDVKFISHVSAAGTEYSQDYNSTYKFGTSQTAFFHDVNAASQSATKDVTAAIDWFDKQTYSTSKTSIGGSTTVHTADWNTIADRPGTSEYAAARGGRFDEVHVVVIDALGTVTGNAGTVLEKHLNLSKAKDAEFSVGAPAYWRTWLKTNSDYIFGGDGSQIGITTTGYSASGFTEFADGNWDQDADQIIFDGCGKQDLLLTEGKSYGGISTITVAGALTSGVDDVIGGYGKFENDTTVDVDFLLMGSAKYSEDHCRAIAQKLIAVAEARMDAVAFISPYRASMISDTDDDTKATIEDDATITTNITDYYSTISSSSYAVFDSGYKYVYDRFNNVFRYIPLNGDIAGCCARTDINDFPWFSPAGTDRGTILNAIKLPYNPTKLQRDALYSNRVNPVIHSPGSGIILFGDKTGFAKSSAFDRINVRRLFIFLEDAISAAAKDQLFEFNDEITRSNFVNIVEPFLRDVQAKRGIQDYVVICDQTNNTAAVIDSNEFIADIYIKPARSINFIGLTFIATRTGVSFEEVIGKV